MTRREAVVDAGSRSWLTVYGNSGSGDDTAFRSSQFEPYSNYNNPWPLGIGISTPVGE